MPVWKILLLVAAHTPDLCASLDSSGCQVKIGEPTVDGVICLPILTCLAAPDEMLSVNFTVFQKGLILAAVPLLFQLASVVS